MEGYVYILSHNIWQRLGPEGAVKIGRTGRHPTKRAPEIGSSSGLLYPPKVEWFAWVADMHAVEKAVHQKLDQYRIRQRRELFAVPVDHAKAVIEASTHTRGIDICKPTWRVVQRGAKRSRKRRRRLRMLGLVAASAVLLTIAALLQ